MLSLSGPCKFIAPHYEKIAKETPSGLFIHIDTDQVRVGDARDVTGIPTFKFFKDGKVAASPFLSGPLCVIGL